MSHTITARQAVLADLDALAPLFDGYRQFYGRAADLAAARAFLAERFNHNESVLFIARDGDAAVGFAQLYPSFSSVSLARTFILNDLFVSEGNRGQGVAKQLLAAAAHHAQSLGAIRLTLSTATTNTAAQSVYEAAGWQRDAQFYVYHLAVPA
jgi:ribosomal protein S18 acetylase RimI-like enzyme